jgi:hypothetical protein
MSSVTLRSNEHWSSNAGTAVGHRQQRQCSRTSRVLTTRRRSIEQIEAHAHAAR